MLGAISIASTHHNFQSVFKEEMENESHGVSKVANEEQMGANGQVKKEACKREDCCGGKVDDDCNCEQCQAVCGIKEEPKNNQQDDGLGTGIGIGPVTEAAQNISIENIGAVCKEEVSQIESISNKVAHFQVNEQANEGTPVQGISYSGTLGLSSRALRAKLNYAAVTKEDADEHLHCKRRCTFKLSATRHEATHKPKSLLLYCPVKECSKPFTKRTSLAKHSLIHIPLYKIDFIVCERKESPLVTQVLVKFENYPNPEWHPLGKGTFQIDPEGLAMRRFRSHLRAFEEWLEKGDWANVRETLQREIQKLPKEMAKCITTGLEAYARLTQLASQVPMDDQNFAFKRNFYVFNILSFLEKEEEEKDRPCEDVEKDEGMVASELFQLVQITGKIDFDM